MTYEQEMKLMEIVRKDDFYQQLLRECEEREPDYHRILDALNEQDRDTLELYIATCEDLEYRRTCIAYSLIPEK